MRMLAPCVGTRGPRDHVERAGAVAETLASGAGHNHGAFTLCLESYEFHDD